MVKRTPKSQKLYRWRITRIKASPAALIGYVEAPDQEQGNPSCDPYLITLGCSQYRVTLPRRRRKSRRTDFS